MSEMEAIQCDLAEYGLILYPGRADDPPGLIRFDTVEAASFRMFDEPNRRAVVFEYVIDRDKLVWKLDRRVMPS